MDKDGLRKQIFDELQAQFDAKLREARRQKTEAEEELEGASERWRNERRRLNGEIDRLETALAEAKEQPRRKTGGETKQTGIDPQELAKLQAAAEENFKKAALEWETERNRLNSNIARLESAVADAIERSSNPIRSTQPLKEHFEAKLEEVTRERLEVEQKLLRFKADWDDEKKTLTGELLKLRRLAPSSKALEAKEKLERARGRKETPEEHRIRELEERLSDAHADVEKFHRAATNAREEARNQFQPRLEDTYRQLTKLEDQLATATK
jgi:DNA repair exonuclease SbcCD ATPase subunit